MEQQIIEYIDKLKQKRLFRKLPHYDGIDFSSNDYLGLSGNPDSLEAGFKAAQKFGTGSTGSRLLSGNKHVFEEFEEQIAKDKNSESALIFNSGYIANSSVISAFAALGYLLIFDKLNHASMYQFGANAKLLRFHHLDCGQLEKILEEHKNYPKKLIVSETVFGMDGDIADVERLSQLSEKYHAILYLDEAHATGLYGKHGCGLSANFPLNPKTTVVMGTFSKALASSGAYAACSNLFKEYLIQVSKGFIYSTALSPFCIGVAEHNWGKIPTFDSARKRIFELADYLRNQLEKKGCKYIGNGTNIVPIIFDSTEQMLTVHDNLLKNNIITSAVRPPTSPTSRIRIAINARHSLEDVNLLLDVL